MFAEIHLSLSYGALRGQDQMYPRPITPLYSIFCVGIFGLASIAILSYKSFTLNHFTTTPLQPLMSRQRNSSLELFTDHIKAPGTGLEG